MMIAGSKTIVQDFRNSKIPSILIKQIQKARRAAESRVNASAVKRVFPVSKDEFNPEAGKEILRQIKADATETLKIATEAETKRAEKARPTRFFMLLPFLKNGKKYSTIPVKERNSELCSC